jgi:dTDP-glucose pyrophosphorylase
MKMKPTLLVLAAGMGSRYGGLKQIDPLGPQGETIIDYSLYDAIEAGFGKVVFVIRRDIESDFRDFLGSRWDDRIEIAYAFQELDALPEGFIVPEGRAKPWGTAHAIAVAKDHVETPFLVINGDDFYGREAFLRAVDFLNSACDDEVCRYGMVGYHLGNTLSENGSVSRGICEVNDRGQLVGVLENTEIVRDAEGISNRAAGQERQLDFDAPTSMNMLAFTPSIFTHIDTQFTDFLKERGQELKSEFYIPTVVNDLIAAGRATVQVLDCEAKWFGVTYREDKACVQQSIAELVKQGTYPEQLWA